VRVLHIGQREKAEDLLEHVAGKVRHHVSEEGRATTVNTFVKINV
jgi:hypothetical protein